MVPFEKTIEIASSIVERRIVAASTKEEAAAVLTLLISLQTNFVPTQFVTEAALKSFWQTKIRPSAFMTEFMLGATSEFRFRSEFTGTSWNDFLNSMALSCSMSGEESCLDETLRDRAQSAENIYTLLRDNPWAVLVIVFSYTPRPVANRIKRVED